MHPSLMIIVVVAIAKIVYFNYYGNDVVSAIYWVVFALGIGFHLVRKSIEESDEVKGERE